MAAAVQQTPLATLKPTAVARGCPAGTGANWYRFHSEKWNHWAKKRRADVLQLEMFTMDHNPATLLFTQNFKSRESWNPHINPKALAPMPSRSNTAHGQQLFYSTSLRAVSEASQSI